MSKEQYKFPMVDNEYYEKKYSGIENSLIYDEQKDKETIRKESNSDKVYVGLSSKHINEPTIATSVDIIDVKRHYYLTAGYVHELNPKIDVKPSLLVKTEGVTTTLDLTSILEYNKKIWGGVTYRPSSRAVLLLGMHINDDLKFGFSYDIPTTNVSTSGSFEFMLGYQFKIDYNKVVKGFKNPRFL